MQPLHPSFLQFEHPNQEYLPNHFLLIIPKSYTSYLIIHPSIQLFTHPFNYSPIHPLLTTHPFTHPFNYSPIHSLTHLTLTHQPISNKHHKQNLLFLLQNRLQCRGRRRIPAHHPSPPFLRLVPTQRTRALPLRDRSHQLRQQWIDRSRRFFHRSRRFFHRSRRLLFWRFNHIVRN